MRRSFRERGVCLKGGRIKLGLIVRWRGYVDKKVECFFEGRLAFWYGYRGECDLSTRWVVVLFSCFLVLGFYVFSMFLLSRFCIILLGKRRIILVLL